MPKLSVIIAIDNDTLCDRRATDDLPEVEIIKPEVALLPAISFVFRPTRHKRREFERCVTSGRIARTNLHSTNGWLSASAFDLSKHLGNVLDVTMSCLLWNWTETPGYCSIGLWHRNCQPTLPWSFPALLAPEHFYLCSYFKGWHCSCRWNQSSILQIRYE